MNSQSGENYNGVLYLVTPTPEQPLLLWHTLVGRLLNIDSTHQLFMIRAAHSLADNLFFYRVIETDLLFNPPTIMDVISYPWLKLI